MRPLIVIEFLTLDGVMQSFGSPEEDPEDGFAYGGWGASYRDAVLDDAAAEGQRTTTAYLFGRRTYEHMAAFWSEQPDSEPMAAHLNSTPKYVASRRLSWPKWANTQVLAGDLSTAVNSIKARGVGNIAVLGSGLLVQELIGRDLVDGYRLFLHPLALGTGKRLFNDLKRPTKLRLVNYQATSTGVLMLNYSRVR